MSPLQLKAPRTKPSKTRHDLPLDSIEPLMKRNKTKCSPCFKMNLTEPKSKKFPSPKPETSAEESEGIKSYKCSACYKEFSTYQALGGHKSSHMKLSNPNEQSLLTTTDSVAADSKVYECSICRKRFPTGQALGGHKRRHFEGMINGHTIRHKNTTASEVTTSSEGATSTALVNSDRVVFDVDLNLPALPESSMGNSESVDSDVSS